MIGQAEIEELKRLYAEYAEAAANGAKALAEKGMHSPEFAEADWATGRLYRRMREMLAKAGQRWIA